MELPNDPTCLWFCYHYCCPPAWMWHFVMLQWHFGAARCEMRAHSTPDTLWHVGEVSLSFAEGLPQAGGCRQVNMAKVSAARGIRRYYKKLSRRAVSCRHKALGNKKINCERKKGSGGTKLGIPFIIYSCNPSSLRNLQKVVFFA